MGFGRAFGGILNDIMGVSSAGRQNQANALDSMALNHAYQKEFAQNGLQWTVQDAQKAGINPLYAIGGGATGASGGGVASGNTSPTGASAVGLLEGIANLYNQTRATSAGIKQTEAQTELTNLQAWRTAYENGLLDKYGEKEKIITLQNMMKTGNLLDADTAKKVAEGKLTLEQANRIKGGKLSEWGGTEPGSFWFGMEDYLTKKLRGK